MENAVKERVKKFISSQNLSVNKFEKMCGLSTGYVGNMRVSIQPDKLTNIANMFPMLNTGWLITGEGEMLKDSKVTTQNSYSLPLIPIDVVAGFPDGDLQGILISDCAQYVIPEFKTLKAEYMIRVSGSSMYPKYSNGDILACRKLHSINFFQWGKIYVLDTEQGALVKRLFEDKSDLENIICHSDNSDRYPDFVLPKSEIRNMSYRRMLDFYYLQTL
jgi:repressor LexA